ncbi:hypothetical protein LDO31_03135 [Luteimonas sp. XNQY3]|nr:hypothetical protein [Luteimonas sp. XNQY3]MCD9005242.1 hypothetical protein [Luteimonas sp. XNQY3]
MGVYFESVNDDAAIQIDDTFANFAYVQSVAVQPVASTDQSAQAGTGRWSFSVQGIDPLLAVSAPDGVALDQRTQSGSVFNFSGLCETTGSITFYVFDRPVMGGSGQYLEIRNAANEVVFDASARYMRVMGQISSTGGAGSISVPAGRTYGALLGLSGQAITVAGGYVGGGPYWLVQVINERPFVRVSGGVASYGRFRSHSWAQDGPSGVPTPNPGQYGSPSLITPVVDITGY